MGLQFLRHGLISAEPSHDLLITRYLEFYFCTSLGSEELEEFMKMGSFIE